MLYVIVFLIVGGLAVVFFSDTKDLSFLLTNAGGVLALFGLACVVFGGIAWLASGPKKQEEDEPIDEKTVVSDAEGHQGNAVIIANEFVNQAKVNRSVRGDRTGRNGGLRLKVHVTDYDYEEAQSGGHAETRNTMVGG